MKNLFIALLLSTYALGAQAESLQVEILVFDRGERRSPETYPKRLDLSWPKNVKLLGEPQAEETDGFSTAAQPLGASPVAELDWWPAAAPESLTLTADADRIARHFGGQILLHTGWLLPPSGPVLFKSEKSVGERPRLMGYARIKRGRHIDLETNLWAVDFAPNNLEPGEGWPTLPRWPGDALSLAPQLGDADAVSVASGEQLDFDARAAEVGLGQGLTTEDTAAEDTAAENTAAEDTPLFSHEPYRVERIIQIKDARRLKLGELNYIDHPRLGVLIKVSEAAPTQISDSSGTTSPR